MKKIKWNRRTTRGFTLVEILAAIAIMFILFATLGVAVGKIYRRMEIKTAQAEMESVMVVLEEYYENHGSYPRRDVPTPGQTFGLVTALDGHYECKYNVVYMYWIDPWSNEYVYSLVGGSPVIRSWGPYSSDIDKDGTFNDNTDDDLIKR